MTPTEASGWLNDLNTQVNNFSSVINDFLANPRRGLTSMVVYFNNSKKLIGKAPEHSLTPDQVDTYKSLLQKFSSSYARVARLNEELAEVRYYDGLSKDNKYLNNLLIQNAGTFYCIKKNPTYDLIKQPCVDKYINAILDKLKAIPPIPLKPPIPEDTKNLMIKTFNECIILFDECFSKNSFGVVKYEELKSNNIILFLTAWNGYITQYFSYLNYPQWGDNKYLLKYLRFNLYLRTLKISDINVYLYPFLVKEQTDNALVSNFNSNPANLDFMTSKEYNELNSPVYTISPTKTAMGFDSSTSTIKQIPTYITINNIDYYVNELGQYADLLNNTDNNYQVVQLKDKINISKDTIILDTFSVSRNSCPLFVIEKPRPIYGEKFVTIVSSNILSNTKKAFCDKSRFYNFDKQIFRPIYRQQIENIVNAGKLSKSYTSTTSTTNFPSWINPSVVDPSLISNPGARPPVTTTSSYTKPPYLIDELQLFDSTGGKVNNLPNVDNRTGVSFVSLNDVISKTPSNRGWGYPPYNKADVDLIEQAKIEANNTLKDLLLNKLAKQTLGIEGDSISCIISFLDTQYPGFTDSLNFSYNDHYTSFTGVQKNSSILDYLISFFYTWVHLKSYERIPSFFGGTHFDHGYIYMYMYYHPNVYKDL